MHLSYHYNQPVMQSQEKWLCGKLNEKNWTLMSLLNVSFKTPSYVWLQTLRQIGLSDEGYNAGGHGQV